MIGMRRQSVTERDRVGEGVGENERKDARVNDTYR